MTDSSKCVLQAGGNSQGTATIGSTATVQIDTEDATYGVLEVKAQTLQFSGILVVSVKGYDPNKEKAQNDLLQVDGEFQNITQASLAVDVRGAPQNPNAWLIIKSTNIVAEGNDNFKNTSSTPKTNLSYGPPNKPKPGDYQVQFPGAGGGGGTGTPTIDISRGGYGSSSGSGLYMTRGSLTLG